MDESLFFWLSLTLVFLAAGLVKGVTGMGLPTVAMGFLGSIMSPAAAAALLIIPSLATNIWQYLAGPSRMKVIRRFWSAMVGIAIGTTVSTGFLVRLDPDIIRIALGSALVIYAMYALASPRMTISTGAEQWLSPIMGLITGAVTGLTAVFAIPAVPYYQALNLDKDELVQTLGLSFTVSTLALAGGLVLHGAFVPGQLGLSAAAILPALAGMWLGQIIRARISARLFRLAFLLLLLILGLEMGIRALL